MMIDISSFKTPIKPKADNTLYNMRKSDLIEYIRYLENNFNITMPVVYCLKCKMFAHINGKSGHCYPWHSVTLCNDFCSYGQQKESSHDD